MNIKLSMDYVRRKGAEFIELEDWEKEYVHHSEYDYMGR